MIPFPTSQDLTYGTYRRLLPYNQRVETFLKDNLATFSHTLVVHYRGTDRYHTGPVSLSQYFDALSRAFETGQFDQVYIATDEEQVIEQFVDFMWQKYQFDNITYNQTIQSKDGIGIHFVPLAESEKILPGNQVILDAHSLSACDTVICTGSNLIAYALILNTVLKPIYLDLHSRSIK